MSNMRSVSTAAFTGQGLTGRLWWHLDRWSKRRELRRALARMDAHLLRDVGWLPHEAAHECAKPFWKG